MSDTIDTLVRRLDSALSRIDAMGADALDARTEQHRLNTLLAAAQKRAEEAEARATTMAADLSACYKAKTDLIAERDRLKAERERFLLDADERAKTAEAERDRLRADLAAQRAAPVDARVVGRWIPMADDMKNTERLAVVCECSLDTASSIEVVMRMVSMLDMDALAKGIRNIHRADALMPFLDPTAYSKALHDGRLDRSSKALRALLDCAKTLKELTPKERPNG